RFSRSCDYCCCSCKNETCRRAAVHAPAPRVLFLYSGGPPAAPARYRCCCACCCTSMIFCEVYRKVRLEIRLPVFYFPSALLQMAQKQREEIVRTVKCWARRQPTSRRSLYAVIFSSTAKRGRLSDVHPVRSVSIFRARPSTMSV
ncbi:unnamed protein product, partial [Pylaiella littoralis]